MNEVVRINGHNIEIGNTEIITELGYAQDFCQELIAFIRTLLNPEIKTLSFQTSGSVGKPKILNFTKEQCFASAKRTLDFFHLQEGDTVFIALPMRYVATRMMIIRALVGNLDLHLLRPSSIPQLPEKNVRLAAFTPMQMHGVLDTHNAELNLVENVILGGAATAPKLIERLSGLKSKVYETYGMTETLTHIAMRSVHPEVEPHFHALPSVSFSINEDDALQIRDDSLDITLHTNDMVELISEKSFKWRGRRDNIVNSGGIKIQLEETEEKISKFLSRPFICLGLPDERLGEKLVLLIEGEEKKELIDELKASLKLMFSKHEKPKEILLVKRLIRADNGKILRNKNKHIILSSGDVNIKNEGDS